MRHTKQRVRLKTMTQKDYVSPQTIEDIVEKAHQMRAEAVRDSFVDLVRAVKSLFGKASHAISIPKTEQL